MVHNRRTNGVRRVATALLRGALAVAVVLSVGGCRLITGTDDEHRYVLKLQADQPMELFFGATMTYREGPQLAADYIVELTTAPHETQLTGRDVLGIVVGAIQVPVAGASLRAELWEDGKLVDVATGIGPSGPRALRGGRPD
ncbi:MAG TPA: hypothetical protein VEB19_15680 [Gemmatimonadaceae bacterium]|nr:hypothetical protein [Gemmatimonadaceae bacterium]